MSAVYFNRAAKILEGQDRQVRMQVFQKGENTVLCGINHAVETIKLLGGPCKVKALSDGDIVQPWEPVMTIEGDLANFVHLESVYLGLLARMSKVATNTRRVVEAANGKPVLFFADRFDLCSNQYYDGYAATIGGATQVCTDEMARGANDANLALGKDEPIKVPVGTMPHALIAAFGGSVVAATRAFRDTFPAVPLTALVDFNNDCVTDSLACLEEFGDDLYAVRLDTSENMIDRTIAEEMVRDDISDGDLVGDYKPTGVNEMLVHVVRQALDEQDGQHVKIIVSGGFNAEKIAKFEKDEVPVDTYAVGSSLLKGSIDFTADVVKPIAKSGRTARPTSRLREV